MQHTGGKRRFAVLISALLAISCTLGSIPAGALEAENAQLETGVSNEMPENSGKFQQNSMLEETGGLESESGNSLTDDEVNLYSENKVNYALGCTYTGTKPYTDSGTSGYPDTGNKELTDGVVGGEKYEDPEWVGYAGNPPEVELILDLGMERTFDTVETVLNITDAATVRMPLTAEISYSNNGSDWEVFSSEKPNGNVADGVHTYSKTGSTVSGRYVRFYFTYSQFTWVILSEIRVLGAGEEGAAAIPVFNQNLPVEMSVYTNDMVNFQVEAEASDGGTLSYQWYKDGTPIGENSNTYSIPRATLEDAGVYRVEVTNDNGVSTSTAGSIDCTLKVVDGGGDPGDPDEPVLNPDPNNLAEGASYTTSQRANAGYPDTGKKLTDTIVASEASYRDSAWVGYSASEGEEPLSVVIDLGQNEKFTEVDVNLLESNSSGFHCPTGVRVSVSDDQSDWTLLTDDQIARPVGDKIYRYQYVADLMQQGRYVKLDFTSDSSWTFIDEIKVLKYPQTSAPEDDGNNIAFEKIYTSSPAASSEYPDEENKLTDGWIGTEDSFNGLWVGYEGNKTAEIILDLETTQPFEQIEMNFLQNGQSGIQWPDSVKVETSADKSQWTGLFVDNMDAENADGNIYRLKHPLDGPTTARYIKVSFPTGNGVLLDEIKVLKTRTIIPEAPVEEEEMDPNNLSYGKGYTLNFPANASYPDTNNKELTNGRRGSTIYSSREWVGFHKGGLEEAQTDHLEIVVDLESVQNFEQVKVGFLGSTPTGIPFPSGNIKIETSTDNSNWTLFAESGDNYFSGYSDGLGRYMPIGSASARYVKVSVYYTAYWMFMDEIEILAVQDDKEDADINPDNGWEHNLVRDSSYTLSRNPEYNAGVAGTALTDGRLAITGSQYDVNWLGFGSGDRVSVTFDLGAPASVTKVIFSGRENAANAQVLPQNLKIYASSDGTRWGLLKACNGADLSWEGAKDPFNTSIAGATAAYAQYIRVEFDVPEGDDLVFADEIRVIGKTGRTSNAGPVAPDKDEDGRYNLALGKSYTLNAPEAPNEFPDEGGVQLTDGIYGTASLNDTAWVGYERYTSVSGDVEDMWPLKSIIVDLGDVKSITSTKLNILSENDWNSKYTQPWTMRVFASMDGENWMPMYKNLDLGLHLGGIHSYGWRFKDTQGIAQDLTEDQNAPYIARYIRYDIELYEMQLVDEIEVYGYDGIVDGAQELTNLTKLENSRNWLRAGEQTGGVHDVFLAYNGWYGVDDTGKGVGDWTPERYRPYLTYIDRNGVAQDTMFNAALLLGINSRYGNSYFNEKSSTYCKLKDWEWYLDKCFDDGGDVDNLELAAETAAMELKEPDYKVKLIISVPTAEAGSGEFGEINGEMLNFKNTEDCYKALEWYMQEIVDRFNAKEYEHVELAGLYWYLEHGDYGTQRKFMGDWCHEHDLTSYWIPFNRSYAQLYYDKYSIDAMSWQPNHYFGNYLYDNDRSGSRLGTKTIENIVRLCAYCNGSIEMECGDGIFRNEPGKYNQFLDYLNGCAKFDYQGKEYFRMWYNDVQSIGRYCFSPNNNVRSLYEYIYQFINGEYEIQPYIDNVDYNLDGWDFVRPGYQSSYGYVEPIGSGKIGGSGNSVNGGSSGGGSIGGGGSSGGGSVTPDPDDKPDPETPPTGDENYTWEETDDGYQLADKDGEIVTGWAIHLGRDRRRLPAGRQRRRDRYRLGQSGRQVVLSQ